jgi:hypothetical protein
VSDRVHGLRGVKAHRVFEPAQDAGALHFPKCSST